MTTIDDLIREQETRFLDRTPRSQSMWREACALMPGGVTSSWASTRPIPVWIDRGEGSHVWDVDGNEYVDYHAGYGVNVVGHGNPHVVDAVQRRVTMGTHFAQPTPDSIEVARMLASRFGLPQWRFTNSGTEATMDAVHLARAITGRDLLVKIEGSYHGHHDALNVSLWRSLDRLGPVESPHQQSGAGIPQVMADLRADRPVQRRRRRRARVRRRGRPDRGDDPRADDDERRHHPAAAGLPRGVARASRRRHGALLIFDEVKTGLVVAPGGVTELFGVTPDVVCLAKAFGGGIPCGAIGGTDEVMDAIADGRYDQVGTFNGNPLTMAAARTVLCDVLTSEAYVTAEALGRQMFDAGSAALGRPRPAVLRHRPRLQGLGRVPRPAGDELPRVPGASTPPSATCTTSCSTTTACSPPPWAKTESWTLSVMHTSADAERFVANVDKVGAMLATVTDRHSDLFAVGSVT